MKKGFLPAVLFFLIINTIALVFKNNWVDAGIDPWAVMGGNIVLFLVTVISIALHSSAMGQRNTQGFMRNVYGGFMLKFFVIIVAAVLYLTLAKPINKPAVFICMGLYLIYTFLSTTTVLTHKKPIADGNGKSSV